ncbi:hypothetical protein ACFVG1_02410 [Streptomyces bacillaris]|uniref:hypothetical protein n=1 Tax=Streptomyces bacillaris TaxID=68179 RepID=UPI0035DA31A7
MPGAEVFHRFREAAERSDGREMDGHAAAHGVHHGPQPHPYRLRQTGGGQEAVQADAGEFDAEGAPQLVGPFPLQQRTDRAGRKGAAGQQRQPLLLDQGRCVPGAGPVRGGLGGERLKGAPVGGRVGVVDHCICVVSVLVLPPPERAENPLQAVEGEVELSGLASADIGLVEMHQRQPSVRQAGGECRHDVGGGRLGVEQFGQHP